MAGCSLWQGRRHQRGATPVSSAERQLVRMAHGRTSKRGAQRDTGNHKPGEKNGQSTWELQMSWQGRMMAGKQRLRGRALRDGQCTWACVRCGAKRTWDTPCANGSCAGVRVVSRRRADRERGVRVVSRRRADWERGLRVVSRRRADREKKVRVAKKQFRWKRRAGTSRAKAVGALACGASRPRRIAGEVLCLQAALSGGWCVEQAGRKCSGTDL